MSRRDEEPSLTRRKVVWLEVKASVVALTKYQLQRLPLALSQSLHRGLQLFDTIGQLQRNNPVVP